jgi:hypothetical protein
MKKFLGLLELEKFIEDQETIFGNENELKEYQEIITNSKNFRKILQNPNKDPFRK